MGYKLLDLWISYPGLGLAASVIATLRGTINSSDVVKQSWQSSNERWIRDSKSATYANPSCAVIQFGWSKAPISNPCDHLSAASILIGRRRFEKKRYHNSRSRIAEASTNWRIIIEIQTRDGTTLSTLRNCPRCVAFEVVCDYTSPTGARGDGRRKEGQGWRRDGRRDGRGWKGYERAAGSAALIKLAEDNEPVCRLACLAV